jgi:hypothetical protein
MLRLVQGATSSASCRVRSLRVRSRIGGSAISTSWRRCTVRGMVDKMVSEGFLLPQFATMLTFSDNISLILAGFRGYMPPPSKWTARAEVQP